MYCATAVVCLVCSSCMWQRQQ